VLSFGYLFFAQAKKSNSLAAASEIQDRREISSSGIGYAAPKAGKGAAPED
jgi:hypothetical protein